MRISDWSADVALPISGPPPAGAERELPQRRRGQRLPQGRLRRHRRAVPGRQRRPAAPDGAAALTAVLPTPPPSWERPWPLPTFVGWVGFINPASRPGNRERGMLGWWGQTRLEQKH